MASTNPSKGQPLCDPVYILNFEILSENFLSGFGRSVVALIGAERLSIINQIHPTKSPPPTPPKQGPLQ